MREIKFRGKRLDNGQWVCGTPVRSFPADPQLDGIIEDGVSDFPPRPINPATLGQYTGFHDVQGREIYEGDILMIHPMIKEVLEERHVVVFDETFGLGREVYMVRQERNGKVRKTKLPFKITLYEIGAGTVIGNIHDNPELMEGGEG